MDGLAQLNCEFSEKVQNITHLIKDAEARSAYMKLEEQRIYNKRKALEKKIENLKNYIFVNMVLKNTKKVDVGTFTVAIRKNPPKVEVVEITEVPTRFIKEKTEFTVDKKGILAAIKNGEQDIEGIKLVESESIMIR